MFELEGVRKTYRSGSQRILALNNFSLKINPKDYIAIVGPSGAGKSTLLHIIGGLEAPTEGEVKFQGRDIYRMSDKELSFWRNKSVGFVFQFYHLIEELNILDNVAVAAISLKRKYALKTAHRLLEYLGIQERALFFPSQLSGGERQKVAIARALINEPDFILCDEPTGNLDKLSQEKVMGLLEKLNRELGKTIIVVTHNLDLSRRAGRILFLESGSLSLDKSFGW